MKATITRPKPVELPPSVVTLEMNEGEAKILRTLLSGVGATPLRGLSGNETTRALNGIRNALNEAGIRHGDFTRAFELDGGFVYAKPTSSF